MHPSFSKLSKDGQYTVNMIGADYFSRRLDNEHGTAVTMVCPYLSYERAEATIEECAECFKDNGILSVKVVPSTCDCDDPTCSQVEKGKPAFEITW